MLVCRAHYRSCFYIALKLWRSFQNLWVSKTEEIVNLSNSMVLHGVFENMKHTFSELYSSYCKILYIWCSITWNNSWSTWACLPLLASGDMERTGLPDFNGAHGDFDLLRGDFELLLEDFELVRKAFDLFRRRLRGFPWRFWSPSLRLRHLSWRPRTSLWPYRALSWWIETFSFKRRGSSPWRPWPATWGPLPLSLRSHEPWRRCWAPWKKTTSRVVMGFARRWVWWGRTISLKKAMSTISVIGS